MRRAGSLRYLDVVPRSPARGESLFVPGRLCLFGEHSDWAAGFRPRMPSIAPGYCLVVGTDQGLYAEAQRAEGVLTIESVLADGRHAGPLRLPLDARALEAAATSGDFFSYAAGTAREILSRHRVGGLALSLRADLPVQKGLSSSAALCVLVARAFSRVHGLGLDVRAEMELAYAGERRAGSECGRMDQICAHGRRVSALRFDGDALDVSLLAPAAPLHLLIVDLGRSKDTRRILRDLNACFPEAPSALAAGVRDALGPRNAELVGRARVALEAGDAGTLGALMIEAQALFDARVAPACPELRAPRLHEILQHAAVRELAFGGKGVGSGGDGCAQLVCRGPEERDALARRLSEETGVVCLPLGIEAGESQAGSS